MTNETERLREALSALPDWLSEGVDPEKFVTQPCPDDDVVERVAYAIILGSAGERAADHAREFQTANWCDGLRSARAAIAALHQKLTEAK